MMNVTQSGKSDAGHPHVAPAPSYGGTGRFDEGEVAPEKPRSGSLLYGSRILAGLALAGSVLSGAFAEDLHYWGGVNGVYDGSFTNENHWSLNGQHKVPDVGARAYIGYNVSKSYTVTMPEGAYTNFAKFATIVNPGYTVTVDGSDSSLVHPENTQGTYNTSPFCLFYNSLTADMMSFSVSSATPNPTTSPNLVFSNYLFRTTSEKAGSVKTEFVKGLYDFATPCGHVWESSLNPTTYFFSHNSNATAMDRDEIVFDRDVVYKGSKRSVFYGNATTNVFCIRGQADFGMTYWPAAPNGEAVNKGSTYTEFASDGADAIVNLTGRAAIGSLQRASEHSHLFVARNGGKLAFSDAGIDYGDHEIRAEDGGTVVFGPGNQSFHQNTSYRLLRLTARTGGTLLMDQQGSGYGIYLGKAGVDGRGLCHISVTNATFGLKSGGKCNLYNGSAAFGAGALVDNFGSLYFHGNATASTGVLFDGATVTNRSIISFGGSGQVNATIRDSSLYLVSGGTTSGLQLEDATVEYAGSRTTFPSGGKCFVGFSAGKSATLNIRSGTIDTDAKTDIQFELGWLGTGRINVYGGTVNVGRLRMSSTSGSGTVTANENILDVEGGLFNVQETGNGNGVCACNNANRISRIILNGGVLRCYRIFREAGSYSVEADGGTLQANNDSERMVRDVTGSLTLGPKGLVIDNDGHAIDFDIAFADKADANGRLVLNGSGTTKFTGSLADVSTVVADEGTVDLSALSEDSLGSLVATNTAILRLDPTKTVALAGALELANIRLAFASGVSIGETNDLFSYETALSAASREALLDALTVEGVATGVAVALDEVATDDGYVLRATVREQAETDITATATETKTEAVRYRAVDKTVATVSGGAELTLSGKIGTGPFEKTGQGTLILTNPENRFLGGFSLADGRLTVSDPKALGLGNGNGAKIGLRNGVLRLTGAADQDYGDLFSFAQEADTEHVIVDAQVGATMALPQSVNNAGGVTKRGPGRVTFEVEGDAKLVDGNGTHDISKGFWSERQLLVYPQIFDETTGLMTNGTFGALNVNEGELRIVGKGEGARISRLGAVSLALPTVGGSVMPGLVLDNVSLGNTSGARYFFIASCLDYSNPVVSDFADEPYLVLTNGATLSVGTLFCNRLNNNAQQRTRVEICGGSTLSASVAVSPNRAQTSSCKASWTVRDSSLLTPTVSLFRDFTMRFDGSVLAKNADLDPMKIAPEVASVGSSTCTLEFFNGSTFACSTLTPPTADMSAYHPITLVFDDSEWLPAKDADFTFSFTPTEKFLFAVTNTGLVLDVPATRTWTFGNAITGTGGLVKRGEGTLSLGTNAVAYTGVTRTEAGVLDLGKATRAFRLAGAGTVSNGTVADGGLVLSLADDGTVSGGVLNLSNVSFTGRTKVDLGRTGATAPLARPYKTVAIATYTGTAPDLSSWRTTGRGQKGLAISFAAKDGVITMTPRDAGAMIIVR